MAASTDTLDLGLMQARPMPSWAFPRVYLKRPEGEAGQRRVAWNRATSASA